MPRTKKAAGTAVDKRNGRTFELTPVDGGRIDPPEGLLPEVLEIWNAYWTDAASTVQTPADRGVLTRWIKEYDRYLRLIAEADECPLVAGSKGQDCRSLLRSDDTDASPEPVCRPDRGSQATAGRRRRCRRGAACSALSAGTRQACPLLDANPEAVWIRWVGWHGLPGRCRK